MKYSNKIKKYSEILDYMFFSVSETDKHALSASK